MTASEQYNTHPNDVSLKELVELVWHYRWRIATTITIIAILAATAAWFIPKSYTASVIVSPVSESPGSSQFGGLGSLASQFGGLASLAGLSVSGDTKKTESLAVLQSRALTEKYLEQNNLLRVLYAERWDAERNQWQDPLANKAPTLWQGSERFSNKIRNVDTDNSLGLVTLSITWTDPEMAARWANGIVQLANDYLRQTAINQSEKNIIYLNEQAEKTNEVGVKQAIYAILQDEISKQMLARGTAEYAFKIIDPAVAPEEQSSPILLMWVMVSVFLGLVLMVAAAFIRLAWKRG